MLLSRSLAARAVARTRPRALAAPAAAGWPAAGRAFSQVASAADASSSSSEPFVFTPENFRAPKLPSGLAVREVPLELATDESLRGLGYLVRNPEDFTVEGRSFEIVPWPHRGWRKLDPGTGDEAGTTEGDFEVEWRGDFFCGRNLAIATKNNTYLDGLGTLPEHASEASSPRGDAIYLWMSDHHPDGGQLFWPREPVPFVVCLGPNTKGDDIKPQDMRAFRVPEGLGIYIHPGTWHNGIYVAPEHTTGGPRRFLTRQGRIHARISCSWAAEFNKLLRVPLH